MAELSVHFEQVDQDVLNVLVSNKKNNYALMVYPPRENRCPSLKVIGRWPADDEGELINKGAAGADIWWAKYGGEILARKYVHAWVICNEPDRGSNTLDEYMSRLIDTFHINGLKTVAGNWSVGTPEPEDMPKYRVSMSKSDYWGFHSYWLPEHWDSASWQDWLIFRYKRLIASLGLPTKPILFTECGCDAGTAGTLGRTPMQEGWLIHYGGDRERYVRDLRRFADGCGKEVVAAFVFDAGPWPRWESFKVDADLAFRMIQGNTPGEESIVAGDLPLSSGIRIRVGWPDGSIQIMDIEDYVKGVVPREVPASWPMEMLKAQAIAARSYALATSKHKAAGFDVCTTTCCQVYSNLRSDRSNTAVNETAGIVGIIYDRLTIATMFFSASCGGHTLNTWAPSYLKSVECVCGQHGYGVNGHRQGLCQQGGRYYADAGWTWQQIIDHYYDLKFVAEYGLGDVVHSAREAVGGYLPEHEPNGTPGFLMDKIRWWYEEETRQREAGNVARANEIRYSLIKLMYRLENILEAQG